MPQYHPRAAADGVTRTVGSGKDHATIQAAIDWFKQRILTGACYIDVDAGTYDEAVTFEDIVVARGGTLTLRGDTRLLAGLSYVDGADANQGGITNGGSGACSLANAGNDITVTGAGSNPDFDADGWTSGDTVLVYDNTGTITEYTVSSALNNVITLSVAAPAIGNDATAICLLPNRRIERTSTGPCVDDTSVENVTLSGFYLRPSTGLNCDGVYCSQGGAITVENCCSYAEDNGYAAEYGYAALFSYNGAISAWGAGFRGYWVRETAQIRSRYAIAVGCTTGFQVQQNAFIEATWSISVNSTTAYLGQLFGYLHAQAATARQNTTGYYCATRGYLYAPNTALNNNGNGTDYNPAVSDTFGNSNGSITWS